MPHDLWLASSAIPCIIHCISERVRLRKLHLLYRNRKPKTQSKRSQARFHHTGKHRSVLPSKLHRARNPLDRPQVFSQLLSKAQGFTIIPPVSNRLQRSKYCNWSKKGFRHFVIRNTKYHQLLQPSLSDMETTSVKQIYADDHWNSGMFHNTGIFKPAGSARYNFLVQKLKHRKELRKDNEQEGQQLQELPVRHRKWSCASKSSSQTVGILRDRVFIDNFWN